MCEAAFGSDWRLWFLRKVNKSAACHNFPPFLPSIALGSIFGDFLNVSRQTKILPPLSGPQDGLRQRLEVSLTSLMKVGACVIFPFCVLSAFGVLMLRAPLAWRGSEPTLLIPSDSSFYLTAIVESAE